MPLSQTRSTLTLLNRVDATTQLGLLSGTSSPRRHGRNSSEWESCFPCPRTERAGRTFPLAGQIPRLSGKHHTAVGGIIHRLAERTLTLQPVHPSTLTLEATLIHVHPRRINPTAVPTPQQNRLLDRTGLTAQLASNHPTGR